MSIPTVAGAHGGTVRMSIPDVTRHLNAGLGPTLVGALTGSRDRSCRSAGPGRTAGTGPGLPAAAAAAAGRVWAQIAPQETEHVARDWFIGANPFLDGDTRCPRSGMTGPGRSSAATAFVEDSAHA